MADSPKKSISTFIVLLLWKPNNSKYWATFFPNIFIMGCMPHLMLSSSISQSKCINCYISINVLYQSPSPAYRQVALVLRRLPDQTQWATTLMVFNNKCSTSEPRIRYEDDKCSSQLLAMNVNEHFALYWRWSHLKCISDRNEVEMLCIIINKDVFLFLTGYNRLSDKNTWRRCLCR